MLTRIALVPNARLPASQLIRRCSGLRLSEAASLPTLAKPTEDPRVWLEDVEGAEALQWVGESNAAAVSAIGDPKGKPLYNKVLSILDSDEKIPYVGRVLNGLYYNFWQDEKNERGLWRRCTPEEYRKDAPDWETVLDLDALGEADGIQWVWGGSTILDEGEGVRTDRANIRLSRGGTDATVAREFDLDKKAFIPVSDGGFELPEAKTQFCFKDRDTLLVGGAFGDEEMTDSGYPRTSYEWKRGTKLSEAVKVFEGEQSDVSCSAFAYNDRGERYEMQARSVTFYTSKYWIKDASTGTNMEVPIPDDAQISTFADQILVTLRSEWLGHAAGALLAAPLWPFMKAESDGDRSKMLTCLFAPTDTCSLEGEAATRNYLVLSVLEDVVSELRFWRYNQDASKWSLERSYKSEGYLVNSVSGVNADETDELWLTSSGYTQPPSYAIAPSASDPDTSTMLKSLPAFYDASGLQTQQLFATSDDGTKVPYFLISRSDLKFDGSTPTILYGYGGFEISLTPSYIATTGAAWLEKGYAYVQANIRGGGEYGPRWHQAALKENRNKAYEDFEAVAKDLVARGITSAKKLGVNGGSNGGLLTGNMLTRSPDLFGAIVCQVPLLDMRRFHTLLAGASWMGEYGNPDTDDWAFLQNYSPYHNLDPNTEYPPILFTTSTRDDRVHPGHARKMVAKLNDIGKSETTLYYENIEGGHGGAADNKQRAFMSVLAYDFFEQTLADGTAKF